MPVGALHTLHRVMWDQKHRHHGSHRRRKNNHNREDVVLLWLYEGIRRCVSGRSMQTSIPIGSGKTFAGVIDLITNQKLTWKLTSTRDDGRAFELRSLSQSEDPELLQAASEARTALIEQVADLDDEFAELLLTDFSDNFDGVPVNKLQEAVRRVTLARKGVPVLCGSSLKNKGVQPLLDAITAYLPAPNERLHDLVFSMTSSVVPWFF
ncbi:hypothetical protein GOODEAATRI_009587 [Goodea atripinnis]|uniref:Uncharacterized protein n=1 Tax=Goodea atripinnis TaxID=208336 RepID=A0ABV0NIV0_9TELE